jgi:hypothetical protein
LFGNVEPLGVHRMLGDPLGLDGPERPGAHLEIEGLHPDPLRMKVGQQVAGQVEARRRRGDAALALGVDCLVAQFIRGVRLALDVRRKGQPAEPGDCVLHRRPHGTDDALAGLEDLDRLDLDVAAEADTPAGAERMARLADRQPTVPTSVLEHLGRCAGRSGPQQPGMHPGRVEHRRSPGGINRSRSGNLASRSSRTRGTAARG